MATTLYTKNEKGDLITVVVDTKRVQLHLANGYVCDPSELDVKEANTEEKPIHWKTQVRQDAKAVGIEDWKTAKIEVLKGKLDHGNTEG